MSDHFATPKLLAGRTRIVGVQAKAHAHALEDC